MNEQTKVIAVVNEIEAASLKIRLEEQGIPVEEMQGGGSVFNLLRGGPAEVELVVRAADAERAMQLVREHQSELRGAHPRYNPTQAAGTAAAETKMSYSQLTIWLDRELGRGADPQKLEEHLVGQGWTAERARQLVNNQVRRRGSVQSGPLNPNSSQRARLNETERQQALKQILRGALWLGMGVALSWFSQQSGGLGLVFYGAMIWGAFQIFSGVFTWFNGR